MVILHKNFINRIDIDKIKEYNGIVIQFYLQQNEVKHMKKQLIALLLTATMLCTMIVPIGAATELVSTRTADMSDVLDILKTIAKMHTPTVARSYQLDFEKDNKITIKDALEVLKSIAKMRETLTLIDTGVSEGAMKPLLKREELMIKQDYLKFFYTLPNNYNVDGVKIIRYFGNYNGNVVLIINDDYSGSAGWVEKVKIAEYEFIFPDITESIVVYNDGVFYELKQAYNQGLLTNDEIRDIYFWY